MGWVEWLLFAAWFVSLGIYIGLSIAESKEKDQGEGVLRFDCEACGDWFMFNEKDFKTRTLLHTKCGGHWLIERAK